MPAHLVCAGIFSAPQGKQVRYLHSQRTRGALGVALEDTECRPDTLPTEGAVLVVCTEAAARAAGYRKAKV